MPIKITVESSGQRLVDEMQVPVPCPGCNHENEVSIAKLNSNGEFVCSGCGATVKVEGNGAQKIVNALDGIDKAFARIGKR